jgi:hypothetical protein
VLADLLFERPLLLEALAFMLDAFLFESLKQGKSGPGTIKGGQDIRQQQGDRLSERHVQDNRRPRNSKLVVGDDRGKLETHAQPAA